MSARFTFIGKLEANTDSEAKNYFLREGKTSKGDAPYMSLNLQVAQEKNNRAFVELFGMVSKSVKTMDNDFNKIEIAWDDRFDEDSVKEVANFKKTIVKIGDEKKEFIAAYDAVKYIADNIDELKDQTVIVSGQRKKNVYNNKISDRFEFNLIRVVDDEDTVKRLTVNTEFLFNKDSFDTADWNTEHKLYINGWTEEYMSDVKENRYVEQQIVFDCGKINWDNEDHVKKVKFRLKMLGCDLDSNNKIVVKLKAKKLYQMGIVATFMNGQEKVDFDESMLTETQKEALELGLKKLDDFRPSGNIYGERVVVYKLKDFDLRAEGKYVDGCIDSEITQDEFDEKLYTIENASFGDIGSDDDELPFGDSKSKKEDEDDEDDLFG